MNDINMNEHNMYNYCFLFRSSPARMGMQLPTAAAAAAAAWQGMPGQPQMPTSAAAAAAAQQMAAAAQGAAAMQQPAGMMTYPMQQFQVCIHK
jgi:hypothetical protein